MDPWVFWSCIQISVRGTPGVVGVVPWVSFWWEETVEKGWGLRVKKSLGILMQCPQNLTDWNISYLFGIQGVIMFKGKNRAMNLIDYKNKLLKTWHWLSWPFRIFFWENPRSKVGTTSFAQKFDGTFLDVPSFTSIEVILNDKVWCYRFLPFWLKGEARVTGVV